MGINEKIAKAKKTKWVVEGMSEAHIKTTVELARISARIEKCRLDMGMTQQEFAECKYILNPRALHLLKGSINPRPVSTYTSKMRYCRHIIHFLNLMCKLNRMSLGTSARAIGYTHVAWLKLRYPECRRLYISKVRLLLRRKHLKGKCCLVLI